MTFFTHNHSFYVERVVFVYKLLKGAITPLIIVQEDKTFTPKHSFPMNNSLIIIHHFSLVHKFPDNSDINLWQYYHSWIKAAQFVRLLFSKSL